MNTLLLSTRVRSGLVVLLAAVALSGCGGSGGGAGSGAAGGGGGGGGGGWTGGALTPAQRVAAIEDVSVKLNSLPHQDPVADAQTLVAYIKSKPEFMDAGATGVDVWGQLNDGLMVAFLNNDPDVTRAARLPVALPPGANTSAGTRAATLPNGNKAVFLHGFFEADRPDLGPELASMAQKAGYTTTATTATIDAFKQIDSGTGLLFTNMHGCHAPYKEDKTRPHCFLVTKTPVSPSSLGDKTDPMYDEWNSQRVLVVGDPKSPVYAIGPGFVQRYMKFSDYSLWLNNACEAFDTELSDAAFHAGLSAYIGWDDSVHFQVANTAARFILDRLVGANSVTQYAETPPQRPFTLSQIMLDLSTRPGANALTNPTLDHSVWFDLSEKRVTDAHCRYRGNGFAGAPPDQFGMLTPSVSNLEVDEDKQELLIHGIFPVEQGTATLAGANLPVKTWNTSAVTCDLSKLSPSASGDVVVTLRGHNSNAVPLTLWTGSVTVKQDYVAYPGISDTITWNLKYRGDVHGFRKQPHAAVTPGSSGGYCTRDTTCSFTAAGSYTFTNSVDLQETYAVTAPTTPQSIAYGINGPASAAMTVDAASGNATIRVDASVPGAIKILDSWKGTGASGSTQNSWDLSFVYDSTLSQLFPATATFNPSTYQIAGGTIGPVTNTAGKYTMTWTAFAPVHAPPTSTPRSVAMR